MIPQAFQRGVRGLLIAINFLTIAPLGFNKRATREDITHSIPFFPVVGLFIGLLLYVSYLIFEKLFPPFLTDTLIILLWIIITGALHLDGVCDTIDGFYGGRNKDEILKIMRDPHAGAIGTIGVVIFIFLKFAGIHSLPQDIKPASLLLIPGIARGFLLAPAFFLPYARENGTGRDFVEGVRRLHIIIFSVLLILFALPFGSKGFALISANVFMILLFTLYCRKKLNGITGDCFGFLCEVSEVASLIILSAEGKKLMGQALIVIVVVLALISPLSAEEYTMEEVVVTGTRAESLYRDVPAFVSVIKIDNQDKEGLLERSSGLNVNSYGSFGDTLSLSIRGSSSDQVLFLVDGMRIGSGSSSGISFLSLEGVERIEIFRGGASTLYGADAVGGVVNIITKKPAQNYLDTTLSYGSFNTLGASVVAGMNSEGSSMSVGVEHTESEGDFRYKYREQDLTRENNGFKNDTLHFKIDLDRSGMKANLMTRFEMQTKEVPGSYFTPTPEGFERDARSMTLMGLRYNTDSTMVSFNSSFIYHTLFYYDEMFVKRREPSISDNFTTQNYFKIDKKLKDNLLSISPEIRTEFIRSSSAGRHSRSIYSLFLQDEAGFFTKKLVLLPSLRFEHYSDRELYSVESAYRLGMRIKIIDQIYVKANTGTSFRVPSFLDLYWPEDQFAKGNPGLVPERGMDVDAGFGWNLRLLRGEVAYFHNYLHNLIQWAPEERGKWTPSNIGRAILTGIEFQISCEIGKYLSAELSYTNLRALDLTEGQYYKKRLIYRPENVLNMRLKTGIYAFRMFIETIYNSWKYTDRENDKDNRLQGYYKINAGISSPSFYGFSIEFLANNLNDKRYEEVPGYPQPGINFLLKLNYKI